TEYSSGCIDAGGEGSATDRFFALGPSTGPSMNRRAKAEFATLESRLGYRFRNSSLAARALTHLSAQATAGQDRSQSYQRLEFLGDRVLGLVIAEHLYATFPQASEG